MRKVIRRACLAAALAGIVGLVPVFAGCTSNHPEVKITVEFAEKEYVLEYKLYRSMYPQTVQHFIELADAGFYNNTIIHDYDTSYWYGGGYSYDEESYEVDFSEKAMSDYLKTNSKEKAYYELFKSGAFTPSVYKDYVNGEYKDALPTVVGEVGVNHVIQNGKLTGAYGALRMYYTNKTTDAVVYLNKPNNADKIIFEDYKIHSATSLFSIQISNSTSADSSYCIFGQLKDSTVLSDLQNDISTYISDSSYTTSTFTSNVTKLMVDYYDELVEPHEITETYTTTAEPIIIKTVKVTKY
ncbi:MAG: peptidylprolyl isomerase [Candidatus Coproplasma sp.]